MEVFRVMLCDRKEVGKVINSRFCRCILKFTVLFSRPAVGWNHTTCSMFQRLQGKVSGSRHEVPRQLRRDGKSLPIPKPFPSQYHTSALEASFTFYLRYQEFSSWGKHIPIHRTCSVYKEHLLRALWWKNFYILGNFYITKVQIFEDSAKVVLIFTIKKKMSSWQLLFCDLKHA